MAARIIHPVPLYREGEPEPNPEEQYHAVRGDYDQDAEDVPEPYWETRRRAYQSQVEIEGIDDDYEDDGDEPSLTDDQPDGRPMPYAYEPEPWEINKTKGAKQANEDF